MKRVFIMVIAIMLVMTVFISTAFADIRWIKTGNGKPANGRSGPGKEYEHTCYVYYGEQVMIAGSSKNGYTPIALVNGGSGDDIWVLTRFLVTYDPGEFVPSSKSEKGTGTSGSSGTSGGTKKTSGELQKGILTEFKAARWVTPYQVTTYHKRASGVINMRWAPSKKATLIEAYPSGDTLTVLCELKDWYQVQDPDTGKVGFIRSDFLRR